MSLLLCICTYMYTHTHISQTHILGRWGENSQQAGKYFQGEKSRSLHRNMSPISDCTSTWHWCLSCSCWEKPKSSCFHAEQYVRRKQCNFLGQLQERSKGWFLGGEWVEDECVQHTGGRQWLSADTNGKCLSVERWVCLFLLMQYLCQRRTCTGGCGTETCTFTAARDRYTMSLALCNISLGKRQMGVLRALFLTAYDSLDVKRRLVNFSVLIW